MKYWGYFLDRACKKNFNMNAEKKPQLLGKIGTRHVQALVISGSLMISCAMRGSLSLAIVAMTAANSTNPDFKEYSWTANEKSMILTSFTWGYFVMQVPSGYLAGIWSAHKLFSIGLFFSSIINVLIPFLADYGGPIAICADRIAMGMVQACYLPAIHTLISKWAPPQERSRLSSFINGGMTLGNVISMVLSGLIAASKLGWPGIFYVFGIMNFIVSIAFYSIVADEPALHSTISEEEKTYIIESQRGMEHNVEKNLEPPWKDIFTSVPMWAIIVAHFGINWGFWTLSVEIPIYMNSVLKFGITENGIISSVPYLVAWLLSFPSSWLADYAVRKGVSVIMVRRVWNTMTSWPPALLLIILRFVDRFNSIWPIMMIILILGFKSCASCGFHSNHNDISPNFAGTLFSISNSAGTIAGMIAPVLCGIIVQDSEDPDKWHIVFYITACIYFVSNLFFIIFGRGNVQSWNNPKRRVSIPNIPTIYNPKIVSSAA